MRRFGWGRISVNKIREFGLTQNVFTQHKTIWCGLENGLDEITHKSFYLIHLVVVRSEKNENLNIFGNLVIFQLTLILNAKD